MESQRLQMTVTSVFRRWGVPVFCALVAMSPVLPHVPLRGPLSLDDLISLTAAVWGIAHALVLRLRPQATRLVWPILLVMASALISGLGHWDAIATLSAVARWTEVLVLVVLGFTLIRTRDQARMMLAWITGVVTFEAVFGLVAFALRWSGPGGLIGIEHFRGYESVAGDFAGRITGTLGMAATFVAGLFSLGLPAAVGLALSAVGKRRWAWAGSALLIGLALYLTFSRVSLVVGFVGVVALLVVRWPWKIWLPVVLLIVAAVLVTPMRLRLFDDKNDRLQLWYAGLTIWGRHPVIGVGYGKYLQALKQVADTPFGVAGSTPHNSIILAGAELGTLAAIGLAAAIIMALIPGIAAWREHNMLALGALIAFAAFAASAMFANLLFIPSIAMTVWLLPAVARAARGTVPQLSPQHLASP